jgi:hypothetical protein
MRRVGGGVFGRSWARAAAVVGIALALSWVGASSASAGGLKLGFSNGATLQSSDPSVRGMWYDRAVAAQAQVVRLNVFWKAVAPDRPAHPTNPGDTAYNFSDLDAAVKDASKRHLQVMLTVYRAPGWAEGKNRPAGDAVPEGAWKPNPKAFGKFAQALGKRYSGHYAGLPRVRYFEVWNEPNITKFLAPQWEGKKAASPEIYRQLLNNFYNGVRKGQPGAKVIGGAMSPFGDSRTHPLDPSRPRLRPLVFLRKLLCLKHNLKPKKCPVKPHFNIISQHPLNFYKPPNYHPFNGNDIQVATFHKVGDTLRAGERAHHVRPGGHHDPLWATEYGWLTNPPNPAGVSPKRQAKWIEQGFHLLWKQGARMVINYPLRDEPRDPSIPIGRWGTSGIFYHSGKKKPSFDSFRFPFVTDRHSKKKVSAWGKAPSSGKLKIQQERHGHWKTRERLHVHRGQVFKRTFKLRGKATLRAKIGGDTSRVWHQGG